MGAYRFVGSYCEIDGGRIKLDRFGQQVELPDEVAEIVVKGGGAIIPEADFEALGLTEQEVSLYAYPGQQAGAPEVFLVKQKAAWMAFHRHHRIVNGEIVAPVGQEEVR
jgi:hypothetical protein